MTICLLLVCSCTSDDDGTVSTADAPADAAPGLDTWVGEDGARCEPGEVRIIPCCGGYQPPCVAEVDGGGCPAGYENGGYCFNGEPCAPLPCTPPAPYCAPNVDENCGPDCYGGLRDETGACQCICA